MKKLILTLAAAALLAVGCNKEQTSAPVPPAPASIEIDLSAFSQAGTKAGESNIDEFFTFATTQVLTNWMKLYEQIINIPVEAYNLVIQSAPTPSGDGYVWMCNYKDRLGQTYTIKLYGEDHGSKAEWELRVSKNGLLAYEDFCWIDGWSAKDGKSGQWNVKVSPIDTDVVVSSIWGADANGKVNDVKLTYTLNHLCCGIMPFFNGSYLQYKASATDPAYDSSVVANYSHMESDFWTVLLEWNSQNGAGRVQSKNRFGDLSWHSWPAKN